MSISLTPTPTFTPNRFKVPQNNSQNQLTFGTTKSLQPQEKPTLLKANNEEGFTLIEALVVAMIIGILLAVELPSLLNQVERAKEYERRHSLPPETLVDTQPTQQPIQQTPPQTTQPQLSGIQEQYAKALQTVQSLINLAGEGNVRETGTRVTTIVDPNNPMPLKDQILFKSQDQCEEILTPAGDSLLIAMPKAIGAHPDFSNGTQIVDAECLEITPDGTNTIKQLLN